MRVSTESDNKIESNPLISYFINFLGSKGGSFITRHRSTGFADVLLQIYLYFIERKGVT